MDKEGTKMLECMMFSIPVGGGKIMWKQFSFQGTKMCVINIYIEIKYLLLFNISFCLF